MGLVPAASPCYKSLGLVTLCELAIFATSPSDLLQGLVAGTSPIVCADLYSSSTRETNKQRDFSRIASRPPKLQCRQLKMESLLLGPVQYKLWYKM